MSAGERGPRDGAALRILGFGTYDADAHPRVGILLDGLRARGHAVRELDLPLGFSTAQRVRMLREPWRLSALAARLADRWARLGLCARAFRGGRRPDAVVVGYLGHFDVLLARALWPRGPGRAAGRRAPVLVLDHMIFAAGTAADRGAAPGLRTRALRLLDEVALRAADVVVLDTDEHAAQAREALAGDAGSSGRSLVVAPVGAPRAWFAARASATVPAATSPADAPLRVVFYGLFTPLQGTPVIARALRLLGDAGDVPLDVTLVGSGQDEAEVRAILGMAPEQREIRLGGVRVTWHVWVEADALPALVAGHDVCLGILGATPKARAVVPNKVYQGAAAGCAVVTSDTPPQRRALGDAAVLVPPGDAGALAAALRLLAGDRAELDRVRAAGGGLADAGFSARSVAGPVEEALLAAVSGPRSGRR